jgi:hypothetical protein
MERKMRILQSAMLATLVLLSVVPAHAQVANTSPATTVETVGGTMVAKSSVAVCGERWKAHKAKPGYVDPGKGKRSEAWNEFRKSDCADLKVKR